MTAPTISRRAGVAPMAAGDGSNIVNLNVYQGDDMRVDVTFTDSTGAALDPALWSWKAQIRRVSADADSDGPPLAAFTPTVVGDVLQLHLAHGDSEALGGGSYRWDLEGTRVSDGWVTTYLRGAVSVTAEITR